MADIDLYDSYILVKGQPVAVNLYPIQQFHGVSCIQLTVQIQAQHLPKGSINECICIIS